MQLLALFVYLFITDMAGLSGMRPAHHPYLSPASAGINHLHLRAVVHHHDAPDPERLRSSASAPIENDHSRHQSLVKHRAPLSGGDSINSQPLPIVKVGS